MKYFTKIFGLPFVIIIFFLVTHSGCGGDSNLFFTLNIEVVGEGTVTSDPVGIDCETNCSEIFANGIQVELTALPAHGFQFSGWTGGTCSGTATCVVTVNSDLQITATFSVIQIAFSSRADDNGLDTGVSNIWVINFDGNDAKTLAPTTAIGSDSFAQQWSPDNMKIVFVSSRALNGDDTPNTNDTENIWVMNADGSELTPLTQLEADGADCRDPQWSPDGTKIVFRSTRALNGDDAPNMPSLTSNIWVMNADGTNPLPMTKLTAMGASSFRPQWSPDGSRVVFESSRDLTPANDGANLNSTRNIWVVDSNGSNAMPLTQLTADNADSLDPQWSPDGSQIVFESRRDLNPANDAANANITSNIWVVNSDGSNPTPLTTLTANNAENLSPQWSPGNSKIVFQSKAALNGGNAANNSFNIWVMDSNGQNATPLTMLDILNTDANEPVFSADGSAIAFGSDGATDGSNAPNNTDNIFIINTDGTGIRSLTQNTGDKAGSFNPQFNN